MIKIFFILNRKVTPQKNRCVGCWLLALPRAQMTRLSRILGIWFTYYVPVLINFMTPSKHLSIAYQGINLRRLLRFFFSSKAPHATQRALDSISGGIRSPRSGTTCLMSLERRPILKRTKKTVLKWVIILVSTNRLFNPFLKIIVNSTLCMVT